MSNNEIIETYLSGHGFANTAALLGISIWTVQKVVKAAGVQRSKEDSYAGRKAIDGGPAGLRETPVPDDLRRLVIETYLGGASIVDTSRATGVSKWNVEKIVRQDGIARDLEQQYATGITPGGKMIGRPAKPFGEGDEAKILDLYHGGKSAKAIAKNMGFDHHRMTDFIRKATGSEVLKKGCYGSGGYHGIGVDRSAETEGYMTCADCLTLKPVSEFVRSVNAAYGGHMVYCKPCWYEKRTRKAQLKKYYGMTPELYSSMLDAQGGLCAICHKACKSGHRMSVDHCHATGRIRGLLCKNCNNAIGLMCDDIDILKAAILYLSS